MNFVKRIVYSIYLYIRAVLTLLGSIPKALTNRKIRIALLIVLVGLAAAAVYRFLFPPLPTSMKVWDVVWLRQGWTDVQRERYYRTSQGSLIMPYSWFFAMELQPRLRVPLVGMKIDNENMFWTQENTTRFRLIPDPRPRFNPDRLPIGLTKHVIPDDQVQQLGSGQKEWLSYTCAACHTAQLNYQGLAIRIDGAPTLWNFNGFNTELANTLLATDFFPDKFDRFADRVIRRAGRPNTPAEKQRVRNELRAFLRSPVITHGLLAVLERTYPTTEGFGRMDALGRGANGQFNPLDPRNILLANAPVSIPPIWYTHDFDWVQSVAAIQQPMGRNVTEAWGVSSSVDLLTDDPAKRYATTIPLKNLFWMETLVSNLEPPEWPEGIFGPLDREAVERGRVLYEETVFENALDPADEELFPNPNRTRKGLCARCHAPVKHVEPNEFGRRYWQLGMYKLNVIGTDPGDAQNFANRQVYTGKLKDTLFDGSDRVGIGVALQKTTSEILRKQYTDLNVPPEEQVVMGGFRANEFRAPLAYPARPMAGYWATPPFLHNGSVSSLYQLLSPVEERDAVFWVGDLEFDPVNVGYATGRFPGGFAFTTRWPFWSAVFNTLYDAVRGRRFGFTRELSGNSNKGHEFRDAPRGTPGVIGPTLTPRQRSDIVEYMKVIRDVPSLEPEERERRQKLLRDMAAEYEGTAPF